MYIPYPLPKEAAIIAEARAYAHEVASVDAMLGDIDATIKILQDAGKPDALVDPLRRLLKEGGHLLATGATTTRLATFAADCKAATLALQDALGIEPS